MEKDQEFLEMLIKALADHPEAVKVNRTVDEMGVLLTLDVHPEDMGKIIGRSGNTAKAIRTLLRIVGLKNNARVNLKISEPVGGTGGVRKDDLGVGIDNRPVQNTQTTPTKTVDEAMADLKL